MLQKQTTRIRRSKKSANIEENTKKPRENRQKHSQKCANNRNKTQQSVKKKAKIAVQQRKKRIKTTTGKAPGRYSVCRTANSNPKKESARPTNQGNCGAEHVSHTKTIANTKKTPPDKGDTQQLCLPRRGVRSSGRISPRTAEITSQTKNTPDGRAKPIQPTKPSENSRTSRGNKQTHRNMHRQEREYRH